MLWRALLAFLALPGMVAFAVPLWLAWSAPAPAPARRGAALWPAAWLVVLAGASLLLWCVRAFY
ncbi:MAG: virulence factor MviN, partial [Gammaproteobacteria bacterium]